MRVGDLDRSARFYRALGLRPVARWTMEDGERLLWLRDETTRQLLELFWVPRGSRFYEPLRASRRFSTPLLFSARNVGPIVSRLRRLGSRVRADFEEGENRIVFVTDPDGTPIELVGWTDPSRARYARAPLVGLVLSRGRGRRQHRAAPRRARG